MRLGSTDRILLVSLLVFVGSTIGVAMAPHRRPARSTLRISPETTAQGGGCARGTGTAKYTLQLVDGGPCIVPP